MRVCWNWQTGTFEGRVLYGVWVQVPLLAPNFRGVAQLVAYLTGGQVVAGSSPVTPTNIGKDV